MTSIDVSELPPPEPMREILARVGGLSAGDVLHVVHRREPKPLYEALAATGFDFRQRVTDGRVELWIFRAADPTATAAAEEAAAG